MPEHHSAARKRTGLTITFLSMLTVLLLYSFFSGQPNQWLWIVSAFALWAGTLYFLPPFSNKIEGFPKHPTKHMLKKREIALIVGAGSAGKIVANELRNTSRSSLWPIGFIDDDREKHFSKICGVRVIGSRSQLPERIKDLGIDTVIIAIPSAPKEEIREIVELCRESNVKIKKIPRLVDIFEGRISLSMIRDVKVEDLLGRESIHLDMLPISDYMTDKVILVTGAGGSIGSELCRQILRFSPKKILLLGQGEHSIFMIENELQKKHPGTDFISIIADVKNERRLRQIFEKHRPEVVFHAAAHKHVPLMEKQPQEAIKNNIIGTKNMAECAHLFHTERFILISTDKAVNPTSVMGATKRFAELIIQHYNKISDTKYAAVRFGNVLGSRGSVVLLFKQQIAEGGPVTVTHPEMVRYFMTIPEGVQLVIQAGSYMIGGEIFVLDMGKPVKIVDLAKDLIRLSGFEPYKDIDITFSGIRPGEKLYEEMLTADDNHDSTKHELIFITKPDLFSEEELFTALEQLDKICSQDQWLPPEAYKEKLRTHLPSYKSSENNLY
ncbi:polysaccharide biosynthesis protein [Alteribacillus sp. HJP-4]|uniref:polysaccharide biosynthesis protein n=1 Tax=Alteribacillus sp. HJP-4 TaxID=2775394 RepID=UPI0035CCFFAC